MLIRTALFFLLAFPIFSAPLEIMYYDALGDYITERSFYLDVDVENTSLAELRVMLENERKSNWPMDDDLVIIGYGDNSMPQEFFAATRFTDYAIPLKDALAHQPTITPTGEWRIYFVSKRLSNYVRARKDHHWSSPFRFLALVGLQDLQFFGPY